MKKIVIPLLWGLFATIPQPLPATSYKSIIVNQSDGSEMKVTIEDDMKTTVAEGNLVITCTKGDIVLPVIDIKNWTFSTSAGSDDVWTGTRIADRKRNKLHTQLRQNHSQQLTRGFHGHSLFHRRTNS